MQLRALRYTFAFLYMLFSNNLLADVIVIDINYHKGSYKLEKIEKLNGDIYMVPQIKKQTNSYGYYLEALNQQNDLVYYTDLPTDIHVHEPMPPIGTGEVIQLDNVSFQLRFPYEKDNIPSQLNLNFSRGVGVKGNVVSWNVKDYCINCEE